MTGVVARIVASSLIILSVMSGAVGQPAEDECPESQFDAYGMDGMVTPGDANNVRAEPSTSAALVGRVPPGEPFNVFFSGITCADGYLWREIETLTLRGWTVEIPVGGDEPFIVPYVPTPVEVGERAEDGSIRVEESGVAFTVPAGLNIASVTRVEEVGLFGLGSMSAQPSSVLYTLLDEADGVRGEIEIFPYAIFDSTYEYLGSARLETLLSEQPSLLEYAAENRMPQLPQSGAAALFGGAGAYLPFASGIGLRYVTYFAQTSVIFEADMPFEYIYRGITTDNSFFISGQDFPVTLPADAFPAPVSLAADETYAPYLRQLEANLAPQPNSAFTPDLSLIDAVFASLTISDAEAVLELIP